MTELTVVCILFYGLWFALWAGTLVIAYALGKIKAREQYFQETYLAMEDRNKEMLS